MKKIIGTVSIILLTTVACNPVNKPPDSGFNESLYKENGQKNAPLDYVNFNPKEATQNRLVGYSHQRGNEFYNATDGGAIPGPDVYLDRNILARQISFLVTKLRNVKNTTVVVTDDQVWIGVNLKRNKEKKTIYEAKRTALSLTPRYFQIYVTNNAKEIEAIRQLGKKTYSDQNIKILKQRIEHSTY